MSYMYIHCFFKFLARVNLRINSLTFKTENTKTLAYNQLSNSMKIRLRHIFDLSLAFLIQYFSFLSIFQQNLDQQHLINVSVRLQLSNKASDQEMEYWKQLDFSTGQINALKQRRFNHNVSSHKNVSFRNHQTHKSNDQFLLWYTLLKFLFLCCTGLHRL